MTALQRFSPEVSNHLLGRTPMEADFLHVHPISNEKVPDVDYALCASSRFIPGGWSFGCLATVGSR
jgi:hypothetical protein